MHASGRRRRLPARLDDVRGALLLQLAAPPAAAAGGPLTAGFAPLSLEQLEGEAARFDEAALSSGEHGHFCSSTDWVIPASRALMPPREPWIFRLGSGYIALMRGAHPRGFRYAEPVEAYWGLASPLLGPDPVELAAELEELLESRSADWEVLALSGLVDDSPLLDEVRRRLGRRYRVGIAGRTERFVASLEGGLEGFLSRRSKNARRSMRRAARDARDAGFSFEEVPPGAPGASFERILEVERRSWKSAAQVGITEPPMRDFYRLMVPRLARSGRLRLGFARVEGRDVGYVLGAVFGDRYRGLQFSFDAGLRRASVGNAMQLAQIERLAAAGVRSYDLGATGGDYKMRWSDEPVTSVALLVIA